MKDLGAKMIGGNGNRVAFDFYPTPNAVTKALMDFLQNLPYYSKNWKVWEPACGEMAISKVLESYGHKVISTDITLGDNFFFTKMEGIDAIITNPPFSVAQAFIEKSLKDAKNVAMLLKSTYWHADRGSLLKRKPPAYVLALPWLPNFFNDAKKGSPTMDFIWTVWIDGQTDTRYRILNKPR